MAPSGLGQPDERPTRAKRLLWFVALWLAGVATISVVGLVIKLALRG